MSTTVFANGRSVICKSADGKSIAATPDVCLSPPSPPVGPVPIPYPNTASASDTSEGSKSVQIDGEEIMLKDSSVFKTSTGNEAATKSLGMGVVTHQIQGKAAFIAWSMDVKFEGENVPRHLDLMGHNEASLPSQTPPAPCAATQTPPEKPKKPCQSDCPAEPSEARKKKLRRGSPSDEIREIAQIFDKGVCGHGGGGHPMEADHVIALDKLTQMPGFACLPDDAQMAIANDPSNFDPLCKSCNSSKQEKDWFQWPGHSKPHLKPPKAVFQQQQTRSTNMEKEMKQKVEKIDCPDK